MGKGRFEGKVVWITGGGSGIGRALALEMAREGADVAVSGRRLDKIECVANEIQALGRRGLAVAGDVADEASVAEAVEAVVRGLGGLDVAVANAGFGVSGPFEKITTDQWRRQMDVNVVGAATTVRLALPHLRERQGRVALIASVAGMTAIAGNSAYCASKFALRAMGLSLSQELHGSGVSCTNIHPGFVESEINQVDNSGAFHEDWEDRRPQKLMWSAEKAARAIVPAIAKRKREFVFTGHGKVGGFLGRHAPQLVHFAMTRGKAAKKRQQKMAKA